MWNIKNPFLKRGTTRSLKVRCGFLNTFYIAFYNVRLVAYYLHDLYRKLLQFNGSQDMFYKEASTVIRNKLS